MAIKVIRLYLNKILVSMLYLLTLIKMPWTEAGLALAPLCEV